MVAFQEGRAIFNMSASFQLHQEGVNHQFAMPNLIPPEKLLSDLEQLEVQKIAPKVYNRFKKINSVFSRPLFSKDPFIVF